MFFTFRENARWNADRQAVEFGVAIASTAARFESFDVFQCGPTPSGAGDRPFRSLNAVTGESSHVPSGSGLQAHE